MVRMTGNFSSIYDDSISQTRELVTHPAVSKSVLLFIGDFYGFTVIAMLPWHVHGQNQAKTDPALTYF